MATKLTKEEEAMVERALRRTPTDRGVNVTAVGHAIWLMAKGRRPPCADDAFVKANGHLFLNFTDADGDSSTVSGIPRWHKLIWNVWHQGPDGGREASPLNACTLGILKRHHPSGAGKGYFEVVEFNLLQRKYAPYLELLRRSGYGYDTYTTSTSVRVMERARADLLTFGELKVNVLAHAIAKDENISPKEVIFILEQSVGARMGVRFRGDMVSLIQRVSPTKPEQPYGFIPKLGTRKTVRG